MILDDDYIPESLEAQVKKRVKKLFSSFQFVPNNFRDYSEELDLWEQEHFDDLILFSLIITTGTYQKFLYYKGRTIFSMDGDDPICKQMMDEDHFHKLRMLFKLKNSIYYKYDLFDLFGCRISKKFVDLILDAECCAEYTTRMNPSKANYCIVISKEVSKEEWAKVKADVVKQYEQEWENDPNNKIQSEQDLYDVCEL
jgi:hypothetical protein